MQRNLESIRLLSGSHAKRDEGMCVMEAVAYVAGEPHSDHPECACPVITGFLANWNDNLPTDEDRDRLLKPLIPLVIGTRSTKAVEMRRSWMSFDWLVREHAPAWMDLTPTLAPHAAALRGLGEIIDRPSCDLAMPVLEAARTASAAAGTAAWDAAGAAAWAAAKDAAWAAARAAARDAAWDAARDAAWAAAKDAAWAAARDAARAAAWDAAWAAARDAARDAAWAAPRAAARAAAWDAAWAAARDALKPTTERLQLSAQDLVRRMCEVRA